MLVNIFIIDITVELPLDVTAIPQQYKINCVIAGKNVYKLNFYYDDTDLNDTLCNVQSNSFSCTTMIENDPTKNGLTHDDTPNKLRQGLLTVTWEAEEISSGVFRQDNNNGDHRMKCYAERHVTKRTSEYIIVKGNFLINKRYYTFIISSIIISL